MNIYEYARILLEGESLESKLLSPDVVSDFSVKEQSYQLPKLPGRTRAISFSSERAKFPRRNSFHLAEKRGMALHFFANHELLAIEMMAASLLLFPGVGKENERVIKGILGTITDEQKHFKLYAKRMTDFGITFGDFPINDFFWKQMSSLKSYAHFFALMSLTFEAANLDFAKFYGSLFLEFNDDKTARIMKTVYDDEISHVALGRNWLNLWRKDQSLWNYYCSLLPENITPSRAKGQEFDALGRKNAGLDQFFIDSVLSFKDDYQVTNRRDWS